jgi:hypothetical protein
MDLLFFSEKKKIEELRGSNPVWVPAPRSKDLK